MYSSAHLTFVLLAPLKPGTDKVTQTRVKLGFIGECSSELWSL